MVTLPEIIADWIKQGLIRFSTNNILEVIPNTVGAHERAFTRGRFVGLYDVQFLYRMCSSTAKDSLKNEMDDWGFQCVSTTATA
jgi:hypothetical protein